MTENPRADRLNDIADRMFPNRDQPVTMTEEELAASSAEIVANIRRKLNDSQSS